MMPYLTKQRKHNYSSALRSPAAGARHEARGINARGGDDGDDSTPPHPTPPGYGPRRTRSPAGPRGYAEYLSFPHTGPESRGVPGGDPGVWPGWKRGGGPRFGVGGGS